MEKEKEVIKQVIERCLSGDKSAEFELYNRYAHAVYSNSVRMLGNNEDAEEALQDTFINVFNHLKKFDFRVTPGAWIRKINLNICLNKLRSKKLKWIELDFEIANDEESKLIFEPQLINEAIQQLPSGCRAVFTLKAFEEYKHEEIANQLSISISTSKSQYVRAKKILKYLLANKISV